MDDLLQLHEDHQVMRDAIEALRATADLVATGSLAELRRAVESDRVGLHAEVLPHLDAEEEVLHPVVRLAMGSPTATVGMEHDHARIRALAGEVVEVGNALSGVTALDAALAQRVRRVFYGLYAVLESHLEKEEAVYHPYLRRFLSEAQRHELVRALEAAEGVHALAATS